MRMIIMSKRYYPSTSIYTHALFNAVRKLHSSNALNDAVKQGRTY
jgi:hypothetical protein